MTMDKTQVAELIASIKSEYDYKINNLKQEMESTIRSLENLFDIKEDIPHGIRKLNRRTNVPIVAARGNAVQSISVPRRMKLAVDKMQGEFERRELFEMTNNDETGIKSPIGTLSIAFSHLIKNGEIIEVHKARGTKRGLYKKRENQIMQAEPSPVMQKELL